MNRVKIALLLTLTLTLAIAGCSKREEASSTVSFETSTSSTSTAAAAPSADPAAAAVAQAPARIARSTSGADSVAVLDSGAIELVSGGAVTSITADTKDSGKRKYYVSGEQIAEVKPSDSGFKVRTVNGALLWKIKVTDDKIKVSDNEENEHPWVLKTGYPDKAKILDPTEAEIGEVRFANPPSPTRVKTGAGADVWTVEGGSSAAWGVLMMDAVPREQQAIILSELLNRGR